MRVHYRVHCSLPHVQSTPFHTISLIHPATVHTVVPSQTDSSSKLCIHASCHILHKPFTASSMLTLTIFGEQSNHEATQHAAFTRCLLLAPSYCQMFHSAPRSVAHACQQYAHSKQWVNAHIFILLLFHFQVADGIQMHCELCCSKHYPKVIHYQFVHDVIHIP